MAKEKEPKLTRAEKKELKKARKEEIKQKKKDGTYNPDDYEDEGGTGLVILAVIFIILVWLAIFAVLIKMDVGGLGSNIMYPILKDVPVLSNILPDVEIPPEEGDSAYSFNSMEEAIARIQELEAQLATYETSGGASQSRIAELEAQVEALQPYKDNVDQFNETRQKFYDEVVFSDQAPDINEYRTYYESIDPTNAERLYKEVVARQDVDKKVQDYAAAYSSMDPAEAASIFDNMTDNFPLVAKILGVMTAQDRGNIIQNMSKENAAAITAMMDPK